MAESNRHMHIESQLDRYWLKRWYSVVAEIEKSPNFAERLDTELRPNVYSIAAKEQKKEVWKFEYVELAFYIKVRLGFSPKSKVFVSGSNIKKKMMMTSCFITS